MRDMREGICPLCAHQEIIESVVAEFGGEGAEHAAAVTYDPRWVFSGRNPQSPHGELRFYVCRHCGHVQTFAMSPGDIPLTEGFKTRLIQGRAETSGDTRRRLPTTHATLFLAEHGLDQDWPNGEVHTIFWAQPFNIGLHRAPQTAFRGPVVDIHVRLQQQQKDRLAIVAFSLCLTDSPDLQRLPALTAFLPRIEGLEAGETLKLIKEHDMLHGISVAI
jgi:hypothetical protein